MKYLQNVVLQKVSMGCLAISFLALLYLNSKSSNSREYARAQQLSRGLWKLGPEDTLIFAEVFQYDVWSWRKLILGGIMIAATLLATLCRVFPPNVCITVVSTFFSGWIVFLFYFWNTSVMNKYKKPQKDKKGSLDIEIEGWKAKSRSQSNDTRLPITIVTGFLGSGKTTLVKNILSNTIGMKILVIENEIGTEGIDHELLLQDVGKEDIILMNNGCICCTVRSDLLKTFHALFSKPEFSKIDWIVIETTGLADPAPMIQSLYMDELCRERMRLDAVLTVVDSYHFLSHAASHKEGKDGAHKSGIPEPIQQVVFADRVVLNKIDLVSSSDISRLVTTIKEFNSSIDILQCSFGSISPDLLLNIRAFDPSKNKAILSSEMDKIDNVESFSSAVSFIPRDSSGKIIAKKISVNLSTKKSLAKLNPDELVVTVTLLTREALNLEKFNQWIIQTLQSTGPNIYRLKGLLWMKGYDQVFVAHGVHMIFDGEVGPQKWSEQEVRQSKLVLIGVKLDMDELKKGFLSCVDTSTSSD